MCPPNHSFDYCLIICVRSRCSRGNALQVRLTGDPYIVHCVETALIVEALHASSSALEDIDERYSIIPSCTPGEHVASCQYHALWVSTCSLCLQKVWDSSVHGTSIDETRVMYFSTVDYFEPAPPLQD